LTRASAPLFEVGDNRGWPHFLAPRTPVPSPRSSQVEKSPIVIKAGLKKEDAEALKAKLEAAGGKVTLE
jgi:hypothetical protein